MLTEKGKMIEVKEMIKLLRMQNHDMLNDYQVVSGYLQLGRLEQGLAYLKKAIETWVYQRELLRWDYLSTILLLMRLKLEIAEMGVKFTIKNTTNLKNLAISEDALNEFLENTLNLFRQNVVQEERELVLEVDEGENFYCFQFSPCFNNVDEKYCGGFQERASKIAKKSGGLCDLLDNCLICKLPKKGVLMVAE